MSPSFSLTGLICHAVQKCCHNHTVHVIFCSELCTYTCILWFRSPALPMEVIVSLMSGIANSAAFFICIGPHTTLVHKALVSHSCNVCQILLVVWLSDLDQPHAYVSAHVCLILFTNINAQQHVSWTTWDQDYRCP